MEELLAKYFSGEASVDEKLLVESWRSESKENAKTFFDSKITWIATDNNEVSRPDILASILEDNQETKGFQFYLLNKAWPKYAAAAMLILAIGLLFILNKPNQSFDSQSLADGSEISIHGDTQLEIVSMNEEVREVNLLAGRAYFDIERDESRPFIIHTDNAVIKVLGTSFLIDTDESETEVSVESGLVELIKTEGNLSVKLEKGEVGHVSDTNKGIIKKPNDNPNYLAWKTKVLVFKNSEMSEVKKIFEEVYGITVEIENHAFSECRLTAKISKKKAKDAVEIIARTFNVDYEIEGKKVTLRGAGC